MGRSRRRGRGTGERRRTGRVRPPMAAWVSAFVLLAVSALVGLAIWPTTSYEGVNYQVREVRVPRYQKGVQFLSRHYQTRTLARTLALEASHGGGPPTDEELFQLLFEWTERTISPVPDGFTVVDDHPMHIAIRRYGTDDQVADLMATLLVYNGVRATVHLAYAPGTEKWIALVAADLGGEWRLADPARGLLFRGAKGVGATQMELRTSPVALLEAMGIDPDTLPMPRGHPYVAHLEGITDVRVGRVVRPDLHMPLRRIRYELLHRLGRIEAPGWASGPR